MFEFRTLEETPIETVHQAFSEAFSDYSIKFDLPLWRFVTMAKRRGFRPDLSVGAFVEGEMVGFVLNGMRQWRGRPTAYDAGTGVVPDQRKKGVTTGMLREVMRVLRATDVDAYLLEVIKANTPAVELYRKQAFRITRSFTCYVQEMGELALDGAAGVDLEETGVGLLDWELLETFWDFAPSWQNSVDSVMAVPEEMAAVTAKVGDGVVGYGGVERRTGDVPQIAVAPGHRGGGIGRGILRSLGDLTESSKLALVNVDDGPIATHGFLQALGFESLTDQYEMVLEIG